MKLSFRQQLGCESGFDFASVEILDIDDGWIEVGQWTGAVHGSGVPCDTFTVVIPDTIRAVVVGNESLLRGEIAPSELANLIRSVKARISVPVTYADVWEFWLRYPEVHAAVDFVTIHILPYWEDFPVPASEAAAHVESIRQKLKAAFAEKEILIGEVGWPSAGRMRDGALPSPANQARVVQDVLAAAKREHYRVSVIEAFDQPWKTNEGGPAEAVSRFERYADHHSHDS